MPELGNMSGKQVASLAGVAPRGKKKMVALTALMRKIIVRANAKLRDLELSLEKK